MPIKSGCTSFQGVSTTRFVQHGVRSSHTQLDATHVISRSSSLRIAELEHSEQPHSSEFPVGQGHGYLWHLNNYWRLEEKDGGVYMQVETIALSRDVLGIFARFVNPLIRRVSRQSVANLLNATRQGMAELIHRVPTR